MRGPRPGLPTCVQVLANRAFTEHGLIPLVEDSIDDQSVSLRRPSDDAEVGLLCEDDGAPVLIVDIGDPDDCAWIKGVDAILDELSRHP